MVKIAVIDDQERFLLNWKICLEEDVKVLCFFHHYECMDYFKKNPDELENLIFIISDRFVTQYDALQKDFANKFKTLFPQFKGEILLSSSAHKPFENVGRGFLLSIGKEAKTLVELYKMLQDFSVDPRQQDKTL